MSRIADALRKAAAERRRHGRRALPEGTSEPSGETVGAWTFEDVRTADAASDRRADADVGDAGDTATSDLDDGMAAPPPPPAALTATTASGPSGTLVPMPPRRSPVLPGPDLLRYRDIVRRRWRTGLAILIVVVTGVTIGMLTESPMYRSTGLLEIRREGTSAGPIESLFGAESVPSDELETQFGILQSATLARRVVAQLKRERIPYAETPPLAWLPVVGYLFEDEDDDPWTVPHLQRYITVNPQKGSRLVEVSFDSTRPDVAARVVNSIFDNYLQLRMEEAQNSAKWLEGQLRSAEDQLRRSARNLQSYVRDYGLQVLETGKGETAQVINQRLQSLHEELTKAQAERIEKQAADEQARAVASGDLDSPVVQSLSVRLADLRKEHARLTSVFHDDYPAVQAVKSQIAELQRAHDSEVAVVANRVRRDYRAAVRREALLRQALTSQSAMVQELGKQHAGGSGTYESLKREVVTSEAQVAVLNQRLKDVSISAALKAANVGIVDRATPPTSPYGWPLPVTLGLTLVAGLLLGAGGMALQEHLDTSMRSLEDVDLYFGLPTLAAIPTVERERRRLRPAAAGVSPVWRRLDEGRQDTALAEAFAALRTAVLLKDETPAPRALLITSAQPSEGKTTVSINLAISLARLHHRVLLIDANMRAPAVRAALDLPEGPGLVGSLTGELDAQAFVHQQVRPNVDVLAAGVAETSPADLLSLPRMREIVAAACRRYDFVVIDSPALLAHPADVQSLATLADSVILTIRQGTTPREAVAQALAQLTRVSGVVLNRSDGCEIVAADASAGTSTSRTTPPAAGEHPC